MLEENEVISTKATAIGVDSTTRPSTGEQNKKKKKHHYHHSKKKHNSKDGESQETGPEETNTKSHHNFTARKNQSVTKTDAVSSSKREKRSNDTHHAHKNHRTARQKRLQQQLEEQEETSMLSTSTLSIPSVAPGAYTFSVGTMQPHASDYEDIESPNTVMDTPSPITATAIDEDELRREILHDTPLVYAVSQEEEHPEDTNNNDYTRHASCCVCRKGPTESQEQKDDLAIRRLVCVSITAVISVVVVALVAILAMAAQAPPTHVSAVPTTCGDLRNFTNTTLELKCSCDSEYAILTCLSLPESINCSFAADDIETNFPDANCTCVEDIISDLSELSCSI
jgi:hypothetical protein